ncbi:hypothetical protein LPJ72_000008 [Coemansia sp. Benny D160-2]|nr:hypothetical protein LPJ72_000008 [Coemansia sp. Benny D160-2]
MEFQLSIESRPPTMARIKSERPVFLASEYRTLSVHMDEDERQQTRRQRARRRWHILQSAWWRELANELVPLRTAHEQHETEEQQRNASLAKVARQLRNLPFHKDTIGEIYTRFHTSPAQGLESQAITRLRGYHGYNVLRPASRIAVANVIRWFFGGFNRFLWVAMVVFWLCWKPIGNPPQPGNMALAIVIIFVICLQAMFSAWQQWITSRAMHSIASMIPAETVVLRDGVAARVAPAELVPGDVVYLRAGDRAPADVRLVEVSADLLLDRSAFSGSPEPTVGDVNCTSANYLETRNIVVMGANVTQGHCRAIVVSTGDKTVLGRISRLRTTKRHEKTILQLEVRRLVNGLTTLSLVVGTIFVILWAAWLRASFPGFMSVADALANGVGVLVTFVPGSLPISLTLALTSIAKRMQRHKVLIKNLTTVETLGTVSAICCEKTGTLTQRRMCVTRVAFAEKEEDMELGELVRDATAVLERNHRIHRPRAAAVRRNMTAIKYLPRAARRLFETALLCNGAGFDSLTTGMPVHERIAVGDATDCALLRMAEEIFPTADARPAYSTLLTIPFSTRRRWMLAVCVNQLDEDDGAPFMVVKGAPERLLPKCSTIQDAAGRSVPLDAARRRQIEQTQRRWAADHGCRVLLLCRRDFSPPPAEPNEKEDDEDDDEDENPFVGIEDSPALLHAAATGCMHGLCVVGLVGMVDPPRPEIPSAVDTFRSAGIRVFMATGDYAPTAAFVARQCRIITADAVDGLEQVLEHAEGAVAAEKEEESNEKEDAVSQTCSVEQQQQQQKQLVDGNGGAAALATQEKEARLRSASASASGADSQRTLAGRSALVISGPEMRELQTEHWDVVASYEEIVFARITPEQKLQIVEELRARDNYVAVTGDDVPDLPAMRAAHVGVAMGNGSEVVKEAADMVLLDNNFASVVVAIESGRLVFVNLKKVIIYLLPMTNMSEIMPSLLNVVLGLPIPLSTFLMLVINTVTDVWASVALIEEEPENDIMLAPPRNPKSEGLVNTRFFLQAYGFIGLIQTLTGHIAFFLCLYLKGGISPSQVFLAFNSWSDGYLGKSKDELARLVGIAGSSHFMALVAMQWGNMFVARTRTRSIVQQNPFWGPARNLRLLVAIPISIGVALFVNEIAWFNSVFLTGRIPVEFFFIPIPFAFALVACDEARKLLVRCFPTSIFARLAW